MMRALRGLRRGAFGIAAATVLGVMAAFGWVDPARGVTKVEMVSPGGGARPDVSGYTRLLDRYLSVMSIDKVPIATTFDYAGLRRDSQRGDQNPILDVIRRQLLAASPTRLAARERLAWAINAYNFLVIDAVTRRFATGPAGRDTLRSVMELAKSLHPFFDSPVATIEGHSYTLNSFERHFLFADDERTGGVPPAALDPRVHFAIVCAARGCPPLRAQPFTGSGLDDELDAAAHHALASPRHLAVDAPPGGVAASSIFDWYGADFGGKEKAFGFILRYAPGDVRERIERRHLAAIARTIGWDWALNQSAPAFTP